MDSEQQVARYEYLIESHQAGRFFKVIDPDGFLVCITVYRKGAVEVVRRLCELQRLALFRRAP